MNILPISRAIPRTPTRAMTVKPMVISTKPRSLRFPIVGISGDVRRIISLRVILHFQLLGRTAFFTLGEKPQKGRRKRWDLRISGPWLKALRRRASRRNSLAYWGRRMRARLGCVSFERRAFLSKYALM